MTQSILPHIQSWLATEKSIQSDLESNRLTYSISGRNQFINRLMLLQGGKVLSWYGYTLIEADEIRQSPHRETLIFELMRHNDHLTLGRWAITNYDMLLFDVSIPIGETIPDSFTLDFIFNLMVKKFDRMISHIKLLLQSGIALQPTEGDIPISYLQALANHPDIYPQMIMLGLLPESVDTLLRQIFALPHLDSSPNEHCEEELPDEQPATSIH
ncbi:hypothetical protein [Aquabacterium sp.]|uniref:hypothetical protein n=1 Tax=Aquabacterium sp. TaxID=1872578 RepID=UPI004037EF7A